MSSASYTSGERLLDALVALNPDTARLALGDGVALALSEGMWNALPAPNRARHALERLQIYLAATRAHHAAAQRSMVWEPIRDLIVVPVLGGQ